MRATDDPPGQVAQALPTSPRGLTAYTTPAGDERAVDLAAVLAASLGIEEPVTRPAVRASLLADPSLLGPLLGDCPRLCRSRSYW